jgi:hypothetical protein
VSLLFSAERDKLITSLQKAHFFEEFEYDPQKAQWIKMHRKLRQSVLETKDGDLITSCTDATNGTKISGLMFKKGSFFPTWKRRRSAVPTQCAFLTLSSQVPTH